MAAKDQTFTIGVVRDPAPPSRSIFADSLTALPPKNDKAVIEIEAVDSYSGMTERILFDGFLVHTSPDEFKKYLATCPLPQGSVKYETARGRSYAPTYLYANHMWTSRLGSRGEIIFGQFSFNDWAQITREAKAGSTKTISAYQRLAVYSRLDIQVEFLHDLLNKLDVK